MVDDVAEGDAGSERVVEVAGVREGVGEIELDNSLLELIDTYEYAGSDGVGDVIGAGEETKERVSSEDDEEYNPTDNETCDSDIDSLGQFLSDEEYLQAREKKKACKNVFDLVDEEPGFDLDAGTVGEGGDSEYSAEDGDLCESDSEDEWVKPLSKRIIYDPKCNHERLELVIGMQFKDGFDCKRAVTTWSIVNGRFVHFRCVTAKKLLAKCTSPCPWYLYGSVDKKDGSFVIKTLTGDHTCSRAMNNKLVSSRWIARKYLNVFRVKLDLSVKDLAADILQRYKTYVSKDRLYKARAMALEIVRGTVEAHYRSIRSYVAELERVDREGTYELLLGEESVFKGLYIGISALRKGFLSSCRPVIGLDGCHLRTFLGGILLCAVGKDGDNGMFPIAWAVVEIENEACWTWFLTRLFNDLQIGDGKGWTLISDQQKGLENAVNLLAPYAEHRNCARHVYMNWKKQHKSIGLKFLYWKTVSATYEGDFKVAIQELKDEDAGAAEDFMARDVRRFCKAFISTNCCSDSVDNNISETFNGYIVKARALHVIHMLEDIRQSLMVRQVKKYNAMSAVTDQLCPRVRKILEERKEDSVDCIAFPALNNKFEVHHDGDKFVVNVNERNCTCRVWSLTGIPCMHACCAIQLQKKDPADYVHDYLTKSRFLLGYEYGIEPIRGHKMWPEVDAPAVKPPIKRRMPGRPPKKRRIKAREERDDKKKMNKVGIAMQCSNCQQDGHNKRTCRNRTVLVPPVEKKRRGRPLSAKPKNVAQRAPPQATQTTSSSRSNMSATFRERAMARRGIGVYTNERTRNSYYHGTMAQQRVVHVNRRRASTSGARMATTQESQNVDGASTSGL